MFIGDSTKCLLLVFKLIETPAGIFQEALHEANESSPVSDLDLWQFCKIVDILGYDFLNEGSVDETYFLNLIKLAKNPAASISEKDIWNEGFYIH